MTTPLAASTGSKSSVGPVVYAIYVNEVLFTGFPLDVELRQEWGQHDLFFIRVEYQPMLLLNTLSFWPNNAPVRIVWGQAPSNTQIWYGYVNHHTVNARSDSGSGTMQVTYTCIGTSKPMNSDVTKTWGEVTGTYIARTIAQKYTFRAVLTSTNWILPYEVQANESDFDFMNRIADKMGYRFWVSGGTLYFIDPLVILQGSSAQGIPSFYMDKSVLYLDTIRDLEVSVGDNIPGGVLSVRQMYGIDPSSGKPFLVTATNAPATKTSASGNTTTTLPAATVVSPTGVKTKIPAQTIGVVDQISTEWPVTDIGTAQQLVNAWQQRSTFWLAGTAELYGTTTIYPGKLIYMSGNQLNAEDAGYWIVASADHIMMTSGTTNPVNDRYITRVQLLKNTSELNPNLKAIQPVSPEFVQCTLSGGLWVATSTSTVYEGSFNVSTGGFSQG